MKPVRFVVVFLALTMFVTAILPPAVAVAASPIQSFTDSALRLPGLAALSIASVPVITVSIESAAAGADYACTLVSQKPKDWTKMQRRQIFDATWTVKNTGTKNWGQNSIDFKYVSGTKMHTYDDAYDLPKNVGSGKTITLIVDMIAPKTKGYYTAVWGLYKGSKVFCKLSLTINVNR